MAWLKGGRATVTNGSTAVSGWGTLWKENAKEGDIFFVKSNKDDFYEIESITDDSNLILAEPFSGTTGTMLEYAIIVNFTNTPNAGLSAEFASLLAATKVRDNEIQEWLAGTVTGGPNGDGYYPIHNIAGDVQLVPCPALIRPPADREIQTNAGLYKQKKYSLVTSNAPGYYQSLDIAAASVHHLVLNESSCELVFQNGNADTKYAQHISVILEQGTGSNKIDPWPANIRWNQGRAPILSYAIGKKDVFDFFTIDAGVTWMGFYGGTQIPA